MTLSLNAAVASSQIFWLSAAFPSFRHFSAAVSISFPLRSALRHQCVMAPSPFFRNVTRTTRRPPSDCGSQSHTSHSPYTRGTSNPSTDRSSSSSSRGSGSILCAMSSSTSVVADCNAWLARTTFT